MCVRERECMCLCVGFCLLFGVNLGSGFGFLGGGGGGGGRGGVRVCYFIIIILAFEEPLQDFYDLLIALQTDSFTKAPSHHNQMFSSATCVRACQTH